MSQCKATKYPMDPKDQLNKDELGTPVDSTRYKSMVGGLRYLVHTRPDIAYGVGMVSRFMERPTERHQNTVKRVLRYIKGTLEYGLVYTKDGGNNELTSFSDSDLGGHLDDRKSTGGVVFYLNESIITWVSQKQRCVALSSCEAEFMAANATACQETWLRNVLSQVLRVKMSLVVLYVDNKSAIDLSKNPVFYGRSKHIDIRYHFIRDCVEKGEIIIKYVKGDIQRADILTKALTTVNFERVRQLMGVKKLSVSV
ncbi:secreted RxLR effector protein 161-like [Apium graveolens]|uniref:secreted RxLR effector protein 161-like n=1 Tax=Apium graveolens TaxID=4045 RepID=UPI003D7AE4FA